MCVRPRRCRLRQRRGASPWRLRQRPVQRASCAWSFVRSMRCISLRLSPTMKRSSSYCCREHSSHASAVAPTSPAKGISARHALSAVAIHPAVCFVPLAIRPDPRRTAALERLEPVGDFACWQQLAAAGFVICVPHVERCIAFDMGHARLRGERQFSMTYCSAVAKKRAGGSKLVVT
jgi:hypothetical protein